MPSGAISAQGAELRIGDLTTASTSRTFTKLADLEDLGGPSEENTFIDVTNHDSSAVERIASLNDPGEVSLQISFQPDEVTHGAGSSGLRGLLRNQTKRAWRIHYPTTGTDYDEFDGWVSSFEPTAPTQDALRADVSLQISGSITSSTST